MKRPVTIVLTCLNEEQLIADAVRNIQSVLAFTIFEPRFIVVDDGSRNQKLLEDKIDGLTGVRVLRHEQNVGRGRSVSDGILAAKTPFVAFIDPDLEIPAEGLFDCFLALEAGADMAVGKRFYFFTVRDLIRVVLSRGYSYLVQIFLGLPYTDTEAGLKAFRTEQITPILKQTQDARWFWDTEIIARSHCAGLHIVEVPTVVIKRDDKQTTVKLFRDARIYFWSLVRFAAIVEGLKERKR